MISIKEAQEHISNHLISLEIETLPLLEAQGKITSETIYSPSDHPLFDQTAVDGYALKFSNDLFDGFVEVSIDDRSSFAACPGG